MNINEFIFTRTAATKKLSVVNNLTESELFSVTTKTILRIIKEAGHGDKNKKRCKFKTLFLPNPGNDWNSHIESIYNWKKDEIFLDVYIQGDDTDTTVECPLKDLLDTRSETKCLGHIEESWDYGYSHRKPANYDKEDRAEVIRSILTTYIKIKYKDML